MKISKFEEKVYAMFPELTHDDYISYCVIIENYRDFFHDFRKGKVVFVVSGVTQKVALQIAFEKNAANDGNYYRAYRVFLLYKYFYKTETERLKRVENIRHIRQVVKCGFTAKMLLRKHKKKYAQVDAFLNDYKYN